MVAATSGRIAVYRFWTDYLENKKDPGGDKIPVDKVEFGPVGKRLLSTIVCTVRSLSILQDAEGSTDPAVLMAHAKWDQIKPKYDAWKRGQEMPDEGTPLGAWNALTPEQGEAIRAAGIRSVEEIAELTDATIQRLPLPNKQGIVKQAKAFLDSKEQNRLAASVTARDEKIAALEMDREERDDVIAQMRRQIDELAEMVAAKPAIAEPVAETVPERRKPGPKPRAQAAA